MFRAPPARLCGVAHLSPAPRTVSSHPLAICVRAGAPRHAGRGYVRGGARLSERNAPHTDPTRPGSSSVGICRHLPPHKRASILHAHKLFRFSSIQGRFSPIVRIAVISHKTSDSEMLSLNSPPHMTASEPAAWDPPGRCRHSRDRFPHGTSMSRRKTPRTGCCKCV